MHHGSEIDRFQVVRHKGSCCLLNNHALLGNSGFANKISV